MNKVGDLTSRDIVLIAFLFALCFFQEKLIASIDNRMSTTTDGSYVPGELLVQFTPIKKDKQIYSMKKELILNSISNTNIIRSYNVVPGLSLIKLPHDVSVEDAMKIYMNTPGILHAQPNYLLHPLDCFPNDTKFHKLWGKNNNGQGAYSTVLEYQLNSTPDADVDASESWRINNKSEIVVAVIDTGVDYNHPDLQDNIWRNPLEDPNDGNGDGYPGIQGVDDDGDGLIDEDSMNNEPGDPNYINDLVNDDDENGYNDDFYGYDFSTFDDKERDSDPMDFNSHGTHCAGIIGAVGNNNSGVTGMCWNIKIMSLQFINYGRDPYTGSWGWQGKTSDAILAIEYAVQMGAKVLSNSWGGGYYNESLEDAINYAGDAGVIFVAAAGNYGVSPAIYPARYESVNIISVLSTDYDDNISWHYNLGFLYSWGSSYGEESVDLGAPGSNVLSCVLDGEYDYKSGTSMAAPHVSGACALVWAANPNLTHLEVKQKILDTVDPLADLEDLCVTEGRLNVCNAVLAAGPLKVILDDNLEFNPDPNYISINEVITYSIYYENTPYDPNDPNTVYIGTAADAVLFDYLPDQVDFVDAWPTGFYDEPNHVYMWDLGELDPNESGEVYLSVRVNERAALGGTIHNMAAIKADIQNERTISGDRTFTPVDCCSGIIYVDQNATGYNNGACWQDAYTEFYRALDKAQEGCVTQIRVAEGNYRPKLYWDGYSYWLAESFAIPSSVAVYGGFPAGGGTEKQRSPKDYPTILNSNSDRVPEFPYYMEFTLGTIVNISNCDEETILDGFTIADAYPFFGYEDARGIYIEGGTPQVSHNYIYDHEDYGIYMDSTSATISQNHIHDNGHGVYILDADAPAIINNWIYKNNLTGIFLDTVSPNAAVRNNTVAYNLGEGIVKFGYTPDPNIVITNSILWKNQGDQLTGCPAVYSCIYDPLNDPNGVSIDIDENGNITTDPQFVFAEDDNYHLDPNSPCIDLGDFEGDYEGEKDIDDQRRVLHGGYDIRVDMGADEYCGGTDTNYADFNDDGYVDLFDYAELANAWLTEPNDLNPIYDLNEDEIVSLVDLSLFTDEWLWMACWNYQSTMMMSQGGGGFEEMTSQTQITAATQPQPQPIKITAEQLWDLIHWLEEIRKTDKYAQEIPEAEWQDFMKQVYLSFDYLED